MNQKKKSPASARRQAAASISERWHRARVTATRADGRVTESRHGTTVDAVGHAVELAMKPQSSGRGRAYRECRVHGRVSTRLIGTELVMWRVSKQKLPPILEAIRIRAAGRRLNSFKTAVAPVAPATPCEWAPATTRARPVRAVARAFESDDAAFAALLRDLRVNS